MAALSRIPLVIHEQNAVAGTANRWLAKLARKVLVGFPGALPGAVMVGNPVRQALAQATPAAQRYTARHGPLRLLVVGGSLGAAALMPDGPPALAQLPHRTRPHATPQPGGRLLAHLRASLEQTGGTTKN